MSLAHLHPDDVPLFTRAMLCARDVAARYELGMAGCHPHPNPVAPAPLGYCYPHDRRIYLTIRFKTPDGQWTPDPRPDHEVFRTVAHELAHLKYPGHGRDFWDFHDELEQAVTNWRFRK